MWVFINSVARANVVVFWMVFLHSLLHPVLSNLVHVINPGNTPYNGLSGEAPPERGTFSGFRYIKG